MLKVFSRILDEDAAAGKLSPSRILDAGCGVGVIGICAAAAVAAVRGGFAGMQFRCQDRDELARLLTTHNAAKNGIPPAALEAYTEPLLAGNGRWDFILTNIPAKAGKPVLEDFVRRSAGQLNPGGRVIMVAVNPLADFFRGRIAEDGTELTPEEKTSGHCVLVYGRKAASLSAPQEHETAPLHTGPGFFQRYPFYVRAGVNCTTEDIPVRLETIHGVSGFNAPGGAALAMAKLAVRSGPELVLNSGRGSLLVHEPEQGFFPCWLIEFLRRENRQTREPQMVLSGRNILSLESSRHNAAMINTVAHIVPAFDLHSSRAALLTAANNQPYHLIAAFPEPLMQHSLFWESLPPLLADDGMVLAAFNSADAERFDRKKPAGFTRIGSIKRKGFRALAYRHVKYYN